MVTMMVAKMIARGSVLRGLCTSSPAVETASRPMKVKKIDDAATPMPAIPHGADQQQAAQRYEHDGGKIEYATLPRRRDDGVRQPETEHAREQLVEVLRPPDGDGRRRHAVLQQQTSRHSERRDL